MDYINIPRKLIYKERTDLKDFGVKEPGTMNHLLFSNLKDLFKSTDRLKELILRCFNNAYYICTIIPFEDFPDTQVAEYEKLLLEGDPYDREEVCAVSMAMVCKLLPASDAKWRPENSDLIEQIHYRFTHYRWMNSGARNSFEFMEGKHNTDVLIIPPSEFVPRDIIEVIENCSVKDLQVYAEYICERLALLKDSRQRMHGADMAIARIMDSQRELCENTEYNPKKDIFKYTDNDPYLRDFSFEESVRRNYQKSKEVIDYYKEHYPTKDENGSKEKIEESPQTSETEVHQTSIREQKSKQTCQIDELKQQLAEKNQALQDALQVIKEYEKPVMELTAKQKIRMEFALQLLQNSGLKELELNKTKTATLLSTLLGIGHQNCYNYLIRRDYHPQIQDEKTISTIDQFCAEMGIRAFLDTHITRGHKG